MRIVQADARSLPEPPFYFPLRHGRYDVAPGLSRFGRELGGGDADGKVFQFDRTFPQFHAAKLAARRERADCVVSANLRDDVAGRAAEFIVERLLREHPDLFARDAADGPRLICQLTGEDVPLDGNAVPTLVGLGQQIQEDFAILCTSPERETEWLSFAHVCLPNGWAPGEKIGQSFSQIHDPVAGMAEMNRRGREFADLMTHATEGLVRFAWGITFDNDPDHHPTRLHIPFDSGKPQAFLRVERQTIWGFPDVNAALFTIRTYLYDLDTLRRDPATRDPLLAALRTMPASSVRYKGLAPHWDDLIAWIDGKAR
jgi:hypothetical protein